MNLLQLDRFDNMKVAFCGTRGLPAKYGGFETAVDEISKRFVASGYDCDVFCRRSHSKELLEEDQGRRLIYVAGSKKKDQKHLSRQFKQASICFSIGTNTGTFIGSTMPIFLESSLPF